MRQVNLAVLFVAMTALTGCMDALPDGMPFGLGQGRETETEEVSRQASTFEQEEEGENRSEIIDALLARQSVLTSGSAFATVADGALDADSRASAAELHSARLRAEATSRNWLPTLGPNISLTSLGEIVSSILIEQVLFDNGRRRAERAFAAADVEVAAVNLSEDLNGRVFTALSLFITGQKSEEKAAISARALTRMYEFERIVIGRIEGGVSDQADRRVIESKLNDMRSAQSSAQEAAQTARAELYAMTGQDFTGAGAGQGAFSVEGQTNLSVLRAQAEATRTVAQATIDRAGLLPGLTASANVTGDGTTGGLTASSEQGIGFGTGASLRAIEASRETADRRVNEARETARRSQSRLEQRLASYRRQESEAEMLVRESRGTFRLFQDQFQAGQRSVLDVVSIYEQLVQREQAHVDAKYEVLLIQMEMARDAGILADGDAI
ncbi:TolC family protein [Cochlodiniinecator piscidefendens]|uniref:TolC family protein n=1 Tax=Cochlodiniinecator piscidefendens TaxID=2715756 RepID=UPI001E36ABAB|nr:TolC family protein [Cochlodiniinecator piscidefendens]